MGSPPPHLVDLQSLTPSDVVSYLKSAFRPMDFDAVEQALVSAEARRQEEVRRISQSNADLALEKCLLEEEVDRLRAQNEAVAETVLRLKEDNRLLSDRERRANDKFQKLLLQQRQESKCKEEEENSSSRTIKSLKSALKEMECAKKDAESELQASTAKFQELLQRVELLEKEAQLLRDQQDRLGSKSLVSHNHKDKTNKPGPCQDLVLVDYDSEDHSINSGFGKTMESGSRQLVKVNQINRVFKKCNTEQELLLAICGCPQLCLEAVCAIGRRHVSDEMRSFDRGFNKLDACRGTTLARFLTDGDPHGRLKKSVSELEMYDSKGLEDCKILVTQYSKQLFDIYSNKTDPFFPYC